MDRIIYDNQTRSFTLGSHLVSYLGGGGSVYGRHKGVDEGKLAMHQGASDEEVIHRARKEARRVGRKTGGVGLGINGAAAGATGGALLGLVHGLRHDYHNLPKYVIGGAVAGGAVGGTAAYLGGRKLAGATAAKSAEMQMKHELGIKHKAHHGGVEIPSEPIMNRLHRGMSLSAKLKHARASK